MLTLDCIADRLGWQGKDRGRRVRRLLDKMGAARGVNLYEDLGPQARPRYWVEEVLLREVSPSLAEEQAEHEDARVGELHEELESTRELLLGLTKRVRLIEERIAARR